MKTENVKGLTNEQKIYDHKSTLDALKNEKRALVKDVNEKIDFFENRIKDDFTEAFCVNEGLQAALKKLENTNDLTSVENDDFLHQWVRFNIYSVLPDKEKDPDLFALALDALEAYVQDQGCVYLDGKNECLTACIGPSIIINDEGDVLDQDSGKWFIKKSEYSTSDERNNLIEAYMERTGCFPWVVKEGRYGYVRVVSTKSKEAKNEK